MEHSAVFFRCFKATFSVLPFSDGKNVVNVVILLDAAGFNSRITTNDLYLWLFQILICFDSINGPILGILILHWLFLRFLPPFEAKFHVSKRSIGVFLCSQ